MAERISPPRAVSHIIEQLGGNGYEAYAVGGCVRDSLLGLNPCDWDIATDASPEQVGYCFSGYHVIPTGIQHGTVTVVADKMPFEVTTYRIDGVYSDGRRPDDVVFTRSLREDLARRDFTVNAMAWNPREGFVDFFGGMNDLCDKMIRCVGDAEKRFSEDSLRILRCVRFASVLGFQIEEETAAAMHRLKSRLSMIAKERIRAELCKAVVGESFAKIFLPHSDILLECIPELASSIGFSHNSKYHIYDVYEHILRAVEAAPPDRIIRIALLLHDIGKPACYAEDSDGTGHFKGHPRVGAELAEAVLVRLRFSKEDTQQILTLIYYHDAVIPAQPKAVKRWLGKVGPDLFQLLIAVKRADAKAHAPEAAENRLAEIDALEAVLTEILDKGECYRASMLAVNGSDLLALGMRQGKQIGAMLQSLTEHVIEGAKNEPDELLAFASQLLKGGNTMNLSMLSGFRQAVIERNLGVYGVHVFRKGMGEIEHRFRADDYVNIYSASKTFTSVAVGICRDEGWLKLEDKLLPYFPQYQSIASEGTDQIRLLDLLHMSSGKKLPFGTMQLIRQNKNMAEQFFEAPMQCAPGEQFFYENLCTYMLGRVVESVCGKSVRDFLVERLFGLMEIYNPQWMTCPEGHTASASGLMLRTSELARLGRLLLQRGVYQGEQVVSAEYVDAMHTDLVSTQHWSEDSESNVGYGYQVWRCSAEGSWRADGMYGQYSVVIPDQEAVVTVTAHNENKAHDIVRAIFSEIVPLL